MRARHAQQQVPEAPRLGAPARRRRPCILQSARCGSMSPHQLLALVDHLPFAAQPCRRCCSCCCCTERRRPERKVAARISPAQQAGLGQHSARPLCHGTQHCCRQLAVDDSAGIGVQGSAASGWPQAGEGGRHFVGRQHAKLQARSLRRREGRERAGHEERDWRSRMWAWQLGTAHTLGQYRTWKKHADKQLLHPPRHQALHVPATHPAWLPARRWRRCCLARALCRCCRRGAAGRVRPLRSPPRHATEQKPRWRHCTGKWWGGN